MLEFLRIMLDVRTEDRDERGASAVEYGLLIAGIAALVLVFVCLKRRADRRRRVRLRWRRR